MNEVLAGLEREIAPDRARRGLAGVGRAHESPHDLPRVGAPSTTIATSGLRVMNATRSPKNGSLAVLVVVTTGEVGVDRAQLQRDDREALALEAADDLADELALDGVGLAENEGAVVLMGGQASGPSGGRTGRAVRRPARARRGPG